MPVNHHTVAGMQRIHRRHQLLFTIYSIALSIKILCYHSFPQCSPAPHSLARLVYTSLWFSHCVSSQEPCDYRLPLHGHSAHGLWEGRLRPQRLEAQDGIQATQLFHSLTWNTRDTISISRKWMLTNNMLELQLFSKFLLNSFCVFRSSLYNFWTIRREKKVIYLLTRNIIRKRISQQDKDIRSLGK